MDRTDEQLLAAFVGGERGALGALAARHERALLGLARGIVGSSGAACDAVQAAWVRVIRHAAGFKGHSRVRTWLYRIVINECHEMVKARRREAARTRAAMGAAAGPGGATRGPESARGLAGPSFEGPPEIHDGLRRAVDELDDAKRTVVLVCYSAGMTHELAAEVLGVPLGTLKSRLHAALTALRRRLGEEVAA